MCEKYKIENNGIKLFCKSSGHGPLILFIHGACVDGSYFDDCQRYLGETVKKIQYDRRGYGRSTIPISEDFSVEAQLTDICRILHEYDDPAYIVAHSFGAVIAAHAICRFPELFRGGLLYEPFWAGSIPAEHLAWDYINSMKKHIDSNQYASALLYFCKLIGQSDLPCTDATKPAIVEKNFMTFLAHEFKETYSVAFPNFATCTLPVYIGLGTDNIKNHFGVSAEKFRELLGAEIVYFPGGHNAPYSNAQEFAKAILPLLNTL